MPGIPLNPQAQQDAHVVALRRFLIHHGYDMLPRTGNHMGYLMRSALANWKSGVNHRDPKAWDQQILKSRARIAVKNDPSSVVLPNGHRTGDMPQNLVRAAKAHPVAFEHGKTAAQQAANKPKGLAGGPHPTPKVHGGGGGGGGNGGGGGGTDFTAMLTKLLGQSDTAQALPKSLADRIAGVDTAAAAGFQDQLDHLPEAKKNALRDIANWFGQVTKSEGTAASRDQAMADAGSSAMQDAAKGIMSSLGGSAMGGSGEIGAVGANDANTLTAIGANDKMLASDLGPIFKLAQANAKNSRSQQYDQAQSDLQDSLAAAQGKAETDRANALMQILQANNQSRQTNFGNQSGLLNTLASLQISGANQASEAQSRAIENALRVSEINKNSSKNAGGLAAMTPQERADFVDKIVQGITTGKLSWPDALRSARNSVRSAGMNPMNKQVIQTIIGPALSNAGITGQGGGFWPAIYQP